MSCPEEWGRLQEAIWKLIEATVHDERLQHECYTHNMEDSCRELTSKDWKDEKESRRREFNDAITALARCIERQVRK